MIYTSGKSITASLLNSKSELSIIGTFQLVQDNITDLMQQLGIDGLTTHKNYNAMWVVSKNKVCIVKAPFWNSNVAVKSFVSCKTLVKINIDTIGTDESGEICFYSRAELCAIDADTKRIRKMDSINVGDNIVVHASPVDVEYTHFDGEVGDMVEKTQVRSTNIDYLHHCNNIEYLRFILNTYAEKVLSNDIVSVEIAYVNQCFEGEHIQVYKNKLDGSDNVYLKRGEDFVIKSNIQFRR